MTRLLAAFAFAFALALPGAAAEPQTLSCPPLAGASQVEPCPTDERLRYGFIGYCSDNRRMYDGDAETCARFEAYRQRKNVALWEAGAGGGFQGYLSCEQPPERLLAGAPRTMAVSRQGTVTLVRCSDGEGVALVLRTKARCAVVGDGRCGADGAQCRVRCD